MFTTLYVLLHNLVTIANCYQRIAAWSFIFPLVIRFVPSRYLDIAFIMDVPFIACLPAFVSRTRTTYADHHRRHR